MSAWNKLSLELPLIIQPNLPLKCLFVEIPSTGQSYFWFIKRWYCTLFCQLLLQNFNQTVVTVYFTLHSPSYKWQATNQVDCIFCLNLCSEASKWERDKLISYQNNCKTISSTNQVPLQAKEPCRRLFCSKVWLKNFQQTLTCDILQFQPLLNSIQIYNQ